MDARIVIVGAGALGSILAAHLTRAGVDVVLLARGARAEQVAANGVSLRGLAAFTERVPVCERPADLRDADVLIVAVKTYDTEAALAGLRHLKPPAALSLQNGVLKDEQLAAAFGPEAVLGCIADFSGELEDDAAVRFTRNQGLYVGELPSGRSSRVDELASVIHGAGIKTLASENIRSAEWSKYVAWLGLTPVAVLSRLPTYRMLQDEDLGRLQVTLVREGARLAARLGIELDDLGGLLRARTLSSLAADEAVAALKATGARFEAEGLTAHRMSALQDLERGRRLEVEETLGHALRLAAQHGLSLPALETCYRLMKALDTAAAAGA